MKYIKLKISKKAGFWRYKVEVELNLQPQPQASYIENIDIRGRSFYGVTKTGVNTFHQSVILGIADSELYYSEDPTDDDYDYSYDLCLLTYLTRPYQKKVEFYLGYDVDINKVIDAFGDFDSEIGKIMQAPGTPAFNYSLNETKYIKLKISKKDGFWRYKVEVELNLQPQSQAPYMKEIIIDTKVYDKVYGNLAKVEVIDRYDLIVLGIANSLLYHCEDPEDNSYNFSYSLCYSMYLTKSYQKRIEFYLEYNVDINKVIDAFRDLDNEIGKILQV